MKVHDLVTRLLNCNGEYEVKIGAVYYKNEGNESEIGDVYIQETREGDKKVVIQPKWE